MINPIEFILSGPLVSKEPYKYKGHLVYPSPLPGFVYIDHLRYEGDYRDIIDNGELREPKRGETW